MSKIRYKLRNRTARREKAAELREAAAKRTPEQQLARLDARGEPAVAERKRLLRLIAKRREAA